MNTHVVVVGAGIIGCSVAYELARRGARVEVVERRDVGQGATQASAGVLAPHVAIHADSPVIALGERSLALYDEFVARIAADAATAVEYCRTGTLEVATDETFMDRLAGLAATWATRGVAVDLLDGRGARAAEPLLAPDVRGGLLLPRHGFVRVAELTVALRRAAQAHGASVLTAQAVSRASTCGTGWRVITDRGDLSCDAVVVATGSWSGELTLPGDAETIPVRPVRGQLLRLGWPAQALERVVWAERGYLVPWTDGSVLAGATMEEAGFDEHATVAGVRSLIDWAAEIVPSVREAWFAGVRVGLRPGTPDDLPIVGPSARHPGLVYATGHFRNGILLAPLTASMVADWVLDGVRDPALALTTPGRFRS